MRSKVEKLREEKGRLDQLEQRDWLTGQYNRVATERLVNRLIEERGCGVMLVLDVDHLRKINGRHGHIVGDHVLRAVAGVLDSMVFRHDVVGRIDGDMFVVFMPVDQEERFLQERCRQIRERLKEIQLPGDLSLSVSLNAGGAVWRSGDDYNSMFERAKEQLSSEKLSGPARERSAGNGARKGNFMVDLRQVRGELAEQTMIPGAYCQDYETFKNIYRFVERRLRRAKISSYILLLTLTDGNGDFPPLEKRERQMATLRELIQNSLRSGDVFTQYSSCQYLVMVADASAENVEMIASRIREAFYRIIDNGTGQVLLHHCYPMWPAGRPARDPNTGQEEDGVDPENTLGNVSGEFK